MKANETALLCQIVSPTRDRVKVYSAAHFDQVATAAISQQSAVLVKSWADQLVENEEGFKWPSSVDRTADYWDEGPSNDPNYSEYWVEAIPAPPQPEGSPSPDDAPAGRSARQTSQGRKTEPRRLVGQNPGWSEEQWNEITPSWAETYPDSPPASDPPQTDPEPETTSSGHSDGRFAAILNQLI